MLFRISSRRSVNSSCAWVLGGSTGISFSILKYESIGLDHVVGVHRGIDLELLHMRLGHPGIEAMDLLCMDHWLRLA